MVEDYNKQYFDELYNTKIPFYKWYLNRKNVLVEKVLKQYIKRGKLLDIGCGDGSLMHYFSKNFDVYGIDISKYIISAIKKRNKNAKVKVCDIEKQQIPFKQKFDVIFLWNIVEHLHSPEAVLKKIKNNLTKNGIIIIHLPTKNNLLSRLQYLIVWDTLFHDETHIYIKSIREISNMVQKAGYKILDAFSGQFIPFFLTKNRFILNSACQYLVFLRKR